MTNANKTTTHRTDEMTIARKIIALRRACWPTEFGPGDSQRWERESRQIMAEHGLSLREWYVINRATAGCE